VIGKRGGIDRPGVMPQALEHRNGNRISDIAVSDARLEGEDVH
jgi:hypothetical protein